MKSLFVKIAIFALFAFSLSANLSEEKLAQAAGCADNGTIDTWAGACSTYGGGCCTVYHNVLKSCGY
jgi:hypothetical protein